MDTIAKELKYAEKGGLLESHQNKIIPSSQGQRYLNDLLQIFMR